MSDYEHGTLEAFKSARRWEAECRREPPPDDAEMEAAFAAFEQEQRQHAGWAYRQDHHRQDDDLEAVLDALAASDGPVAPEGPGWAVLDSVEAYISKYVAFTRRRPALSGRAAQAALRVGGGAVGGVAGQGPRRSGIGDSPASFRGPPRLHPPRRGHPEGLPERVVLRRLEPLLPSPPRERNIRNTGQPQVTAPRDVPDGVSVPDANGTSRASGTLIGPLTSTVTAVPLVPDLQQGTGRRRGRRGCRGAGSVRSRPR